MLATLLFMQNRSSVNTKNIPNLDSQETRPRHYLALTSLCLAVLVAQIDTAVVNLAMRHIGDDLKASMGTLQWVLDSYNLVYAVLLLTGGLLADLYGRRRIFVTGAVIFTVASILCAIAPSVIVLIGGRALAGLGAALFVPASLALIRVIWLDLQERGRVLGIWAACNGLAMAIGPTLGGVLIGHFGWRSIFLVVVPASVAACALAVAFIPESSDRQGRRFDGMAQLLGAIVLGGLVFAAIQSHQAPDIALAAVAVSCVAMWLFIRVETGCGSSALVPLELFGARAFRGAMIATVGMTFGMYGALFLLPLTWQSTGRFDVLSAGIALMPMALVFVVVSPWSNVLTSRLGTRIVSVGGLVTISAGLILIGMGVDQTLILMQEIGLGLTGLGMGIATGPLMACAVGAVGTTRSGTASALINVARMAGAAFGVAMLGAIFNMMHGGSDGLRAAMLVSGVVQIGCATYAWYSMSD